MSYPGGLPPARPCEQSAAVVFFRDCHQVKLFEVSLAHVVIVTPLLLLALIIRRLSR